MKRLFFILAFLSQATSAQNIKGIWSGNLSIQGIQLPLIFHFNATNDGWQGTMDSPQQGAKGIPLKSVQFKTTELTVEAPNLGLKYVAKLTTDSTLEGTFSQSGVKIPLVLVRGENTVVSLKRPQMPKPPFPYLTQEVSFKNPRQGNVLAGTITQPTASKDFPIVVMITGSGAQNRDEELMGHKPFWVIADYLARNGIGSLRMDDRAVGQSDAGKEHPTSADFATDINAAVDFLADRGYTKIGLLGHSEGGMIAPMVKNKKVKYMILLAGPGIPIVELMKLQTQKVALSSGATIQQADDAVAANTKIYNFITTYKGIQLQQDLKTLLTKDNPTLSAAQIDAAVAQVSSPWFTYFLKFDPQKYLRKVKVPVLALNGTLDVQVTAKENLAGIRANVKKNKKNEFIELPGLNHLFQTAKTGGVNEYAEIEETIAPQVLEKIESWIKKVNP